MAKPTTRTLVEATGISRTYAHDIRAGNQAPSRSLAIYIFRQTGWRHPILSDLTDEQLDLLEQVEPWSRAVA